MKIADWRVTKREIADTADSWTERVIIILHDYLGKKKLSARWVPCLFSDDNKLDHLTFSKTLAMFNCDEKNFLCRVAIVDEAWIRHNTEEDSKQGITPDESKSKKAEVSRSANKGKAIVLWDAHDIIQIDYPEKGKTTTVYISRAVRRF